MTSRRVERTWIRTGGYGRFRGDWVNEVIFQTLNVLEVVDFRFISAFNIPAYIMSSEFTHKVVMKFIQAQFPCTNIFDVKVFEPILRIQRFSI